MKFCTKCGQQILDDAVICVHCGCPVEDAQSPKTSAPTEVDAPNAGFAVLGFFIPLVGLILYLVNMNTFPLKAKSAGKGALISVIVGAAIPVLYFVFSFVFSFVFVVIGLFSELLYFM